MLEGSSWVAPENAPSAQSGEPDHDCGPVAGELGRCETNGANVPALLALLSRACRVGSRNPRSLPRPWVEAIVAPKTQKRKDANDR